MARQHVITAKGLPESPVDAAAHFNTVYVPQVRQEAPGADLVIVFDPADHTHKSWRVAMIEELARETAPNRLNAIEGGDAQALTTTCEYLQSAPGVTGQVFTLR